MTFPIDSLTPRAGSRTTSRETDEALIDKLDRGDEDALRALHQRYAALVFTVAARFVDAATAEEVVQDVFLTLWKKHEAFDSARGSLKGWIVLIARRRAMNELRRKQGNGRHSDESLAELSDDTLEPDEAQWLEHRRAVIRAAVDALPDAQKQALSLAFFDELTHEQIADVLKTPLGTTKTRIRLALRRLAPLLLAAIATAVVVWVVRRREERAARNDLALRMITASDVVPIHLAPAPGTPPEAHGSYRTRPGASVAVLTTSHLPALASKERYAGWVHGPDGWRSLGSLVVESDGRSLSVSETELGASPDEIRVTRESSDPGRAPLGPTVLTGGLAPK